MAAVPRHEVGRRDAPGEVLARDVEPAVARGPVREHDPVVRREQLGDRHVGAVRDVADVHPGQQPHAGLFEHLGERVAHRPDREVVRCHAVAHQAEGDGKLVQDVDRLAGRGERVGGVQT
jgi:hypothetical protein